MAFGNTFSEWAQEATRKKNPLSPYRKITFVERPRPFLQGHRSRDLNHRHHHHRHQEEQNQRFLFETRPDVDLEVDLRPLFASGQDDAHVEAQTFRLLLPVVTKLLRIYKETEAASSDPEFKIACAICNPNTAFFREWGPLLLHAQKFWKQHPHQHRGYYRALAQAFHDENFNPFPHTAMEWPPLLLVENSGHDFDGSLRRWRGLNGEEVPDSIKDLQIEEVLAVYKKGSNGEKGVLVFPAQEIGFVDAENLNYVLQTSSRRENPVQLRIAGCMKSPVHATEKGLINGTSTLEQKDKIRYSEQRQECSSYPYSSEGQEKNNLDLVSSSTKKDKEIDQQNPNNRELDTNYRNQSNSESNDTKIQNLINADKTRDVMEKWVKAFQGADSYCAFTHQWPFKKSQKLRDMDAKFQESLKNFKAHGAVDNDDIRAQFREIEKQLNQERLKWLKDIKEVREDLEAEYFDARRKEADNVLVTNFLEMKNRINLSKEMKRLEERLNEEKSLRTREAECKKRRKNLREIDENVNSILNAWRFEQRSFRRKAELAREEKRFINQRKVDDKGMEMLENIIDRIGKLKAGNVNEKIENLMACECEKDDVEC